MHPKNSHSSNKKFVWSPRKNEKQGRPSEFSGHFVDFQSLQKHTTTQNSPFILSCFKSLVFKNPFAFTISFVSTTGDKQLLLCVFADAIWIVAVRRAELVANFNGLESSCRSGKKLLLRSGGFEWRGGKLLLLFAIWKLV
jgi:hypothetical protein